MSSPELTASPRLASPESGSTVAVGATGAAVLVLVGSLVAAGLDVGIRVLVTVADGAIVTVDDAATVAVAVLVAVTVSVAVAAELAVPVAVAVGASTVVTAGAEMQNWGSDIVGVTKTSRHAWFVKLAPTASGAATTSVTVPVKFGSCGPSSSPKPLIVTVPLAPTAGLVAVHDNEQLTDTKVKGATISSVIVTLLIARPLCWSDASSIAMV
jgi:hypothetical protein